MSDHFNEKAKTWDADEMVKKLSSAIGASILENTSLNPQMNVMDFGAGTGLISSQVAPLVNKIVAVDISEAMLDKLIAKPELQGKVEAVCQNILEQPLTTQFDLIMSAMAMHHVEDTAKLIQTFSEHLISG
ncbi:MAG: class I SAM-dependent methyltransferase, partial [Gammaproteobacteria bacterium]